MTGFAVFAHAQDKPASGIHAFSPRMLLVLPTYDMSRTSGGNENIAGPVSGNVFPVGQVASDAVRIMQPAIRKAFRLAQNTHIIEATAQDVSEMVGVAPEDGTRGQRIERIRQAGRRSGANAVLCSYIYAFRKRVGKDYGIEAPAKVSFELNIIDVANGGLIWKGAFTETQKTLSDDLFQIGKFIKRKGRWIEAREMAQQALENLVVDYNEINRKETIDTSK